MGNEEISIREHRHVQMYPFRFQSETFAPDKNDPTRRPKFAVEPMVYIPAVGWDIVNPMNSGNELMIGFRDYVRMKEMMGYVHLGLSSVEITKMLENLWGKKV